MPYETFSSGLTIQAPTAGTENWAETLRTELWTKISQHDHTGSGKGLQIAAAAIASEAVTEVKLHPDAATRSCILLQAGANTNILDGTISSTALLISPDASNLVWSVTMPKAGKVTHLSLNLGKAVSSGTFTLTLFKNFSTTSKVLDVTSGPNSSGSITAESFVAGDELQLYVSSAAPVAFVTGNSRGTLGTAWGHFIE